MRYAIEARGDHLLAAMTGRQTGEDMRAFLLAVQAGCREHACPRILMAIRQSRPVFKAEDYGLDNGARGYVSELATPACQVALLGDAPELHAAHEYIEVCARQQGLNVRAFRDESAALAWLRGSAEAGRRYRLSKTVVQGAPAEAGVYALWEGEEVVYYGRALGNGTTIRSRLMAHLEKGGRVTHYSWEVCADPAAREAELLREHAQSFGRPPRDNTA